MKIKKIVVQAISFFIIANFFSIACAEKEVIRVGYFPNITHSQAIIGIANAAFQKVLGDEVKIETKIFNAGPSVIEAMFAGALDLAYIGPNPAVNGYIKSEGEALRIVAGANPRSAASFSRLSCRPAAPEFQITPLQKKGPPYDRRSI